MPKHEHKQCPRCHADFECKSGLIVQCQCSAVSLSSEQLDYINSRFEDCLCQKCLLELRSRFNQQAHCSNIKSILVGWDKRS